MDRSDIPPGPSSQQIYNLLLIWEPLVAGMSGRLAIRFRKSGLFPIAGHPKACSGLNRHSDSEPRERLTGTLNPKHQASNLNPISALSIRLSASCYHGNPGGWPWQSHATGLCFLDGPDLRKHGLGFGVWGWTVYNKWIHPC